jgi:hypothetical protein
MMFVRILLLVNPLSWMTPSKPACAVTRKRNCHSSLNLLSGMLAESIRTRESPGDTNGVLLSKAGNQFVQAIDLSCRETVKSRDAGKGSSVILINLLCRRGVLPIRVRQLLHRDTNDRSLRRPQRLLPRKPISQQGAPLEKSIAVRRVDDACIEALPEVMEIQVQLL